MSDAFSCPTCGKPIAAASKHFPFCSDRCRLVDLGRWLREDYRVPRQLSRPVAGDSEDAPPLTWDEEE